MHYSLANFVGEVITNSIITRIRTLEIWPTENTIITSCLLKYAFTPSPLLYDLVVPKVRPGEYTR